MHDSSPDHLRSLGLLPLGSRFRRLGERLQTETQAILDTLDPRVASAWHPILNLIDHSGPSTIGEIAAALGVTQPGITRSVAGLVRAGILRTDPDPDDGRIRRAALTDEGRALVDRAKAEVWPAVEHAVRDLCDGFADDLLDHLTRIEERLAETPLKDRTG